MKQIMYNVTTAYNESEMPVGGYLSSSFSKYRVVDRPELSWTMHFAGVSTHLTGGGKNINRERSFESNVATAAQQHQSQE